MPLQKPVKVAIINYNLGNLFNVKRACDHIGMQAEITSSYRDIIRADAVILPGVGAFGDAMASLKRLDLVVPLKEIADSDKPLIGICLGMQLLMTQSDEFGKHGGLNLIKGRVVKFSNAQDPHKGSKKLKVPQVGWNRIYREKSSQTSGAGKEHSPDCWSLTPLEGISEGEFMYFVHSYYVEPEDSAVVLSTSKYGDTKFCSSLKHKNIFACQFHPERSDTQGLRIYKNLVSIIKREAC